MLKLSASRLLTIHLKQNKEPGVNGHLNSILAEGSKFGTILVSFNMHIIVRIVNS